MKISQLIFLVLILLAAGSCAKDETPEEMVCDLGALNTAFEDIDENTSYRSARERFVNDKIEFTSSGNGIQYTTYLCGNDALFVFLEYVDQEILTKLKNFADDSCSEQINNTVYSQIAVGQTYQLIRDLLEGPGDIYQVNYIRNLGLKKRETIVWYDCADVSRRIQVSFLDRVAEGKTKQF